MPNATAPEPKYDSLFQLITQRLYWFAIGPVLLVMTLLGILNGDRGQQLGFNAAYLLVLAGMPLSRWLDMRSGQAQTADGQPATWDHFRKYSIVAVIVGLSALAATNTWALLFAQ
jgi:hypothetical protein